MYFNLDKGYDNLSDVEKKEYDKLIIAYKTDNNKYIDKYEDSENNSIKINSELNRQLGVLIGELELSEYQKNKLVEELQELRNFEKRFSQVIETLRLSEDQLKKNLFFPVDCPLSHFLSRLLSRYPD